MITFFRDHGWGAPGTWVSYVNAGVLESIERGIAIALNRSTDQFDNPGSAAWAGYLIRLHTDDYPTKSSHDHEWSRAKEVSTDYGLELAEKHGMAPNDVERRFLQFAQAYNWAMRNRPLLDLGLSWGWLIDSRLKGLRPEAFDWLMNVGDADAALKGCEIAHTLAQLEPSEQTKSVIDLALSGLPHVMDAFRSATAPAA